MKPIKYNIQIIFKKLGNSKKPIFGYYTGGNKKSVIEVNINKSSMSKIRTLYHEFTHFVLELFAISEKDDILTTINKNSVDIKYVSLTEDEEICGKVESAVMKVIDKRFKKGKIKRQNGL